MFLCEQAELIVSGSARRQSKLGKVRVKKMYGI